MRITIVKVFSTTKDRERELLGRQVSAWLAANPTTRVVQSSLRLSSDEDYQCTTLVLFCAVATARAEVTN